MLPRWGKHSLVPPQPGQGQQHLVQTTCSPQGRGKQRQHHPPHDRAKAERETREGWTHSEVLLANGIAVDAAAAVRVARWGQRKRKEHQESNRKEH